MTETVRLELHSYCLTDIKWRNRSVSLEFLIDIILPGSTMTLGSTQPLTEMSTRKISWVVKAAGA